VDAQVDLLPRDLGGQQARGDVGGLFGRIEPGAFGNQRRQYRKAFSTGPAGSRASCRRSC
jgi:hypothetical protein